MKQKGRIMPLSFKPASILTGAHRLTNLRLEAEAIADEQFGGAKESRIPETPRSPKPPILWSNYAASATMQRSPFESPRSTDSSLVASRFVLDDTGGPGLCRRWGNALRHFCGR